jgi:hypothetical protein
MATPDIWTFREDIVAADVVGYDVEALDGSIGEVDEATHAVGASFIAVKTGPWIFGKKVVLPAMLVDRVDHDAATVHVSRTKDEIKNAPEYDETDTKEAYRAELGRYYTPGGVGDRESPSR